jgi:VanZ family protein
MMHWLRELIAQHDNTAGAIAASPILLGLAWLSAQAPRLRVAARPWRLPLAYLGLILILSLPWFSSTNTHAVLGRLMRAVQPTVSAERIYLAHLVVRKGAHALEYGLLFLILAGGPLREHRFIALLACLAVASGDEMLQSLEPGRTAMLTDVELDFSAALIAALASVIVSRPKTQVVQYGASAERVPTGGG